MNFQTLIIDCSLEEYKQYGKDTDSNSNRHRVRRNAFTFVESTLRMGHLSLWTDSAFLPLIPNCLLLDKKQCCKKTCKRSSKCLSDKLRRWHFLPFVDSIAFFPLYCCAGWGYIVASANVVTVYQLYHIWIHPFHHYSLSPSPRFMEEFQQVSFFHLHACVHIFAPYSLSYPLSPPPSPSHWCQPSSLGRTCSALLVSDFAEE
jgi:hypothetical protein